MENILSCEYNMDTGYVEILYTDGNLLFIDCEKVEDAVDANMYQRSELDWLIYNKPFEYVQLVLSGEVEKYISGTPEHRLED